MENVKQILDELDDGYKYFAIKKDGCWYKIEFDSFMVKDIERAQNICSELNQMLKNACEGKNADTGENNALLPDVSNLVCPTHGTKLYKHPNGLAYCSLCNYSIKWQTCC